MVAVGQLPKRLQGVYAVRAAMPGCPELGRPWSGKDVADFIGVQRRTVSQYISDAAKRAREGGRRTGDIPEPEGWASEGRGPWWWPATIVAWHVEERPGQGAGGGRPWQKETETTDKDS